MRFGSGDSLLSAGGGAGTGGAGGVVLGGGQNLTVEQQFEYLQVRHNNTGAAAGGGGGGAAATNNFGQNFNIGGSMANTTTSGAHHHQHQSSMNKVNPLFVTGWYQCVVENVTENLLYVKWCNLEFRRIVSGELLLEKLKWQVVPRDRFFEESMISVEQKVDASAAGGAGDDLQEDDFDDIVDVELVPKIADDVIELSSDSEDGADRVIVVESSGEDDEKNGRRGGARGGATTSAAKKVNKMGKNKKNDSALDKVVSSSAAAKLQDASTKKKKHEQKRRKVLNSPPGGGGTVSCQGELGQNNKSSAKKRKNKDKLNVDETGDVEMVDAEEQEDNVAGTTSNKLDNFSLEQKMMNLNTSSSSAAKTINNAFHLHRSKLFSRLPSKCYVVKEVEGSVEQTVEDRRGDEKESKQFLFQQAGANAKDDMKASTSNTTTANPDPHDYYDEEETEQAEELLYQLQVALMLLDKKTEKKMRKQQKEYLEERFGDGVWRGERVGLSGNDRRASADNEEGHDDAKSPAAAQDKNAGTAVKKKKLKEEQTSKSGKKQNKEKDAPADTKTGSKNKMNKMGAAAAAAGPAAGKKNSTKDKVDSKNKSSTTARKKSVELPQSPPLQPTSDEYIDSRFAHQPMPYEAGEMERIFRNAVLLSATSSSSGATTASASTSKNKVASAVAGASSTSSTTTTLAESTSQPLRYFPKVSYRDSTSSSAASTSTSSSSSSSKNFRLPKPYPYRPVVYDFDDTRTTEDVGHQTGTNDKQQFSPNLKSQQLYAHRFWREVSRFKLDEMLNPCPNYHTDPDQDKFAYPKKIEHLHKNLLTTYFEQQTILRAFLHQNRANHAFWRLLRLNIVPDYARGKVVEVGEDFLSRAGVDVQPSSSSTGTTSTATMIENPAVLEDDFSTAFSMKLHRFLIPERALFDSTGVAVNEANVDEKLLKDFEEIDKENFEKRKILTCFDDVVVVGDRSSGPEEQDQAGFEPGGKSARGGGASSSSSSSAAAGTTTKKKRAAAGSNTAGQKSQNNYIAGNRTVVKIGSSERDEFDLDSVKNHLVPGAASSNTSLLLKPAASSSANVSTNKKKVIAVKTHGWKLHEKFVEKFHVPKILVDTVAKILDRHDPAEVWFYPQGVYTAPSTTSSSSCSKAKAPSDATKKKTTYGVFSMYFRVPMESIGDFHGQRLSASTFFENLEKKVKRCGNKSKSSGAVSSTALQHPYARTFESTVSSAEGLHVIDPCYGLVEENTSYTTGTEEIIEEKNAKDGAKKGTTRSKSSTPNISSSSRPDFFFDRRFCPFATVQAPPMILNLNTQTDTADHSFHHYANCEFLPRHDFDTALPWLRSVLRLYAVLPILPMEELFASRDLGLVLEQRSYFGAGSSSLHDKKTNDSEDEILIQPGGGGSTTPGLTNWKKRLASEFLYTTPLFFHDLPFKDDFKQDLIDTKRRVLRIQELNLHVEKQRPLVVSKWKREVGLCVPKQNFYGSFGGGPGGVATSKVNKIKITKSILEKLYNGRRELPTSANHDGDEDQDADHDDDAAGTAGAGAAASASKVAGSAGAPNFFSKYKLFKPKLFKRRKNPLLFDRNGAERVRASKGRKTQADLDQLKMLTDYDTEGNPKVEKKSTTASLLLAEGAATTSGRKMMKSAKGNTNKDTVSPVSEDNKIKTKPALSEFPNRMIPKKKQYFLGPNVLISESKRNLLGEDIERIMEGDKVIQERFVAASRSNKMSQRGGGQVAGTTNTAAATSSSNKTGTLSGAPAAASSSSSTALVSVKPAKAAKAKAASGLSYTRTSAYVRGPYKKTRDKLASEQQNSTNAADDSAAAGTAAAVSSVVTGAPAAQEGQEPLQQAPTFNAFANVVNSMTVQQQQPAQPQTGAMFAPQQLPLMQPMMMQPQQPMMQMPMQPVQPGTTPSASVPNFPMMHQQPQLQPAFAAQPMLMQPPGAAQPMMLVPQQIATIDPMTGQQTIQTIYMPMPAGAGVAGPAGAVGGVPPAMFAANPGTTGEGAAAAAGVAQGGGSSAAAGAGTTTGS
ncbi:unnamed protein product [Amoebophrya sp. A120]|nr:unnamed protein product [Amoebophrya sp. A120]|eukprot:GSA120T00009953001.1